MTDMKPSVSGRASSTKTDQGWQSVALRRVHVIGGMGTGKTFLARRLGAAISAPVVEMDLGFDLQATLAKDRWVTEGVYLWQVEPILDAADTVVWLDLPYRTCVRRVVVRHALASARGQNRYKGLRRLWSFAWGSRWYWQTEVPRAPDGPTDWGALSRAQTLKTLEPYWDKVISLASRREVTSWPQRSGMTRVLSEGDGSPTGETVAAI